MLRKIYSLLIGLLAVHCVFGSPKPQFASAPNDSVKQVLRRVSDWEINYLNTIKLRWPVKEWVYSTYYIGLYKTGVALGEQKYIDQSKTYCERSEWLVGTGNRRYFADDYLIGDLYCKLYDRYHDEKMIKDFRNVADSLIARKSNESLEFKNMNVFRVWSWCDAMFMGPPSLAALANSTHEKKYLTLTDSLFWKTYDFLYDKDEHLYYRDGRFLKQKEKNGQKMFWGRGNGWVLAGLARLLEEMPKNAPNRKRYEQLFKDMSARIASLQQADGMWRASLLDPDTYPSKETSGTGLYCYGLTWGINHGLLKKKDYKPVVLKAWSALYGCVHPDGKLGYVQKIAEQPGVTTTNDHDAFGAGAFLLAGTEILKLK